MRAIIFALLATIAASAQAKTDPNQVCIEWLIENFRADASEAESVGVRIIGAIGDLRRKDASLWVLRVHSLPKPAQQAAGERMGEAFISRCMVDGATMGDVVYGIDFDAILGQRI